MRMSAESGDEVIASLRIALLNDFGKADDFGKGANFRQLAACLKSFLPFRKRAPIVQAPPGKPMILIPATTGSNLANLLPVAKEAWRRGLLGGIVAGESFQKTRSEALAGFEHVVSETALRSLVGIGFLPKSLARASRRLKWLIEQLNQHDPHCAKLVKQNYGSYIRLMVLSEGMGIAYKKLLSAWRPSIMISTSDFWPSEFQCCHQANQLGIPTAILQHGVISDLSVWPTYHNTFLAWGEMFRKELIQLGAPANRIRVAGMPASDLLFARSGQVTYKVGPTPVCLVLSHTQDRIEEVARFDEFGRCLAEAICSMPGIKWKIRLHPAESDSFYRERGITELNAVEIVSRDVSLEESIADASVVCTIRSTAGTQAMMMRKPLLILHVPALSAPPVPWPMQGGGLYVKDATAIKTSFNRLVTDKAFADSLLASQDAFLGKAFACRGKAAAAIVDFLAETSLV